MLRELSPTKEQLIGFEETAKIYSVSDSKKNGGKIGWVYKTQLSKKILNEIEKINVGQLTKPITTPGGFILLKLNCLLIVGNYFDGKYIYNFRNWYKS